MLEGIDGVMTRITEIQDKMRQFCPPSAPQDGSTRDFASMVSGKRDEIDAIIREKSSRLGLDEKLVRSVVAAESNYDPKAVSAKGAQGLMQLMPQTAKEMGVNDVFDTEENLEGGSQYLKLMLDRYGNDVQKALAAYNAGPGAVDKAGKIPEFKETQSYVKKVLDLYNGIKGE